MDVGFVGLGVMGSRMATRLINAKHNVVVFDINPEAHKLLVERGGQPATSAKDVASRSDVVFCSLGMPQHLETVLTGKDGVIEGTRAKIAVDLSTTGSIVEKRASAALAAKGIVLLDAPVSGGSHGAEAGTLAMMVSGPEPQFKIAEPLIQVLGKVFYLGAESGSGQTMKLINNMVGAACTIATFEALVFGTKSGLDPKQMCEVLSAGGGINIATTHKVPKCVLPRTFPKLFTTDLMYKDVRLGAEEAEAIGAPLWVINATRNFLAFAISQGDGPVDWANTIKHFEGWAGVTVGSPAAGNRAE